MLTINQLSINHSKDLQPLIKELTITINPHDKVGIIGEEGTGKSTLMAYLAKQEQVLDYALVTGKVTNTFTKTIYLPQILDKQSQSLSIHDFLFQELNYENCDFGLLYQLANQMNFDSQRFDDKIQTIAELSGGERLKLQFIKALAQEPDLLLLDEPSSDLDLTSLLWLERFIKNTPITVVFISHDDYLLRHTTSKIIHLEQIKKGLDCQTSVASLNYGNYIQERENRLNRQTHLAHKEREDHQKRLDKLNRTKSSVHHALNATKDSSAGRLLKKKMKILQATEKRFQKESEHFTPLPDNPDKINLHFSKTTAIKGKKVLLFYEQKPLQTGQICQLTIHKQDKIAIVGQNGIGKTLLLKQIYHDLSQKYPTAVAYMPQTYHDILKTDQTLIDFMTQDKTEQARTLLASLKFNRQEVEHSIKHLSGGQMAKLLLAKMVLEEKSILLLDEPTRYLSPTSQPEIRRLLNDFQGTLITVSHDRAFINEVCQKVYELDAHHLNQID